MGARVGVLGLTFKENVPDLRNTRVVDILAELKDYGVEILVHDAEADREEAERELGVSLCALDEMRDLDAVILAVPHAAYRDIAVKELKGWFSDPSRSLVVDVKGFFDRAELAAESVACWRL
jgi:UDP-N-acetyl-D-galactosamine dehydrogenase